MILKFDLLTTLKKLVPKLYNTSINNNRKIIKFDCLPYGEGFSLFVINYSYL